ncbi:hypothetical protein [Dactylosporangium sp. CA-139066]
MGPSRDDRRPWEGAGEPRLPGAAVAVLVPLIVATVTAVTLLGLAAAGRL